MAEMGKLFVVTGPSGAGVRDIAGAVLENREDLVSVTPVTARKKKAGEVDGVGYYFYDLDGWAALKESGDLLETTVLAGNDYGTSRRLVAVRLEEGKNVLLSLEVERAAQLKANMPEAVCVYLEPSSEALLRERYAALARSSFELDVRMQRAREERALSGFCDCRIATDDPQQAVKELNDLIDRQ